MLQNKTRREILAAGVLAAVSLPMGRAWATSPDLKMARVTVGFPAGDMMDTIARLISEFLRGKYADVLIVENKPGATARIAIASVVKSQADGSEVLFTPGSTLVLFPHVFRNLAYNPLKDLVPVTQLAVTPIGLAIGPGVPPEIKTLEQYFAWCKQDPQKRALYATSGAGSAIHLTGEYLTKLSNVPLTMVPYKGGAPAVNDLVAGQVPAQMATIPSLIEFAKAGKIRFLAISSSERISLLPDVPTFKELGFKDLVTEDFFATYVPAGTPAPVVDKLNQSILAALKDDKVRTTLERMGLTIRPSESPQQFKAAFDKDYAKWGKIAKSINFSLMD